MQVDWNKMTADIYDSITKLYSEIKADKCRLTLLKIELTSLNSNECFNDVINQIDCVLSQYDDIDKEMKNVIL